MIILTVIILKPNMAQTEKVDSKMGGKLVICHKSTLTTRATMSLAAK